MRGSITLRRGWQGSRFRQPAATSRRCRTKRTLDSSSDPSPVLIPTAGAIPDRDPLLDAVGSGRRVGWNDRTRCGREGAGSSGHRTTCQDAFGSGVVQPDRHRTPEHARGRPKTHQVVVGCGAWESLIRALGAKLTPKRGNPRCRWFASNRPEQAHAGSDGGQYFAWATAALSVDSSACLIPRRLCCSCGEGEVGCRGG